VKITHAHEQGSIRPDHRSLPNASVKSLRPLEPTDPSDPPPPQGGERAVKEPHPAGAWSTHGVKLSHQTHRSRSDPEARLYRKGDLSSTRLSYLTHDLIDTKSRVILQRRVSQVAGSAEREVALQMLDEVLKARTELGLPKAPEILTADTGYGSAEFVADVLERGITPHVPLLSSANDTPVVTYQRRTLDLGRALKRKEKIRLSIACQLVRSLYTTAGYQVSRKLRIRSEHLFAEAKNEHGLGRARSRGAKRIQIQMETTGVVQNLKRLANYVHRKPIQWAEAALRGIRGALEGLSTLFRAAYSPYDALWSHQAVSGDATGRFNSDAPPTSTKRVDKSGVTETPASSTPF
jgi:hypothetical protein